CGRRSGRVLLLRRDRSMPRPPDRSRRPARPSSPYHSENLLVEILVPLHHPCEAESALYEGTAVVSEAATLLRVGEQLSHCRGEICRALGWDQPARLSVEDD